MSPPTVTTTTITINHTEYRLRGGTSAAIGREIHNILQQLLPFLPSRAADIEVECTPGTRGQASLRVGTDRVVVTNPYAPASLGGFAAAVLRAAREVLQIAAAPAPSPEHDEYAHQLVDIRDAYDRQELRTLGEPSPLAFVARTPSPGGAAGLYVNVRYDRPSDAPAPLMIERSDRIVLVVRALAARAREGVLTGQIDAERDERVAATPSTMTARDFYRSILEVEGVPQDLRVTTSSCGRTVITSPSRRLAQSVAAEQQLAEYKVRAADVARAIRTLVARATSDADAQPLALRLVACAWVYDDVHRAVAPQPDEPLALCFRSVGEDIQACVVRGGVSEKWQGAPAVPWRDSTDAAHRDAVERLTAQFSSVRAIREYWAEQVRARSKTVVEQHHRATVAPGAPRVQAPATRDATELLRGFVRFVRPIARELPTSSGDAAMFSEREVFVCAHGVTATLKYDPAAGGRAHHLAVALTNLYPSRLRGTHVVLAGALADALADAGVPWDEVALSHDGGLLRAARNTAGCAVVNEAAVKAAATHLAAAPHVGMGNRLDYLAGVLRAVLHATQKFAAWPDGARVTNDTVAAQRGPFVACGNEYHSVHEADLARGEARALLAVAETLHLPNGALAGPQTPTAALHCGVAATFIDAFLRQGVRVEDVVEHLSFSPHLSRLRVSVRGGDAVEVLDPSGDTEAVFRSARAIADALRRTSEGTEADDAEAPAAMTFERFAEIAREVAARDPQGRVTVVIGEGPQAGRLWVTHRETHRGTCARPMNETEDEARSRLRAVCGSVLESSPSTLDAVDGRTEEDVRWAPPSVGDLADVADVVAPCAAAVPYASLDRVLDKFGVPADHDALSAAFAAREVAP